MVVTRTYDISRHKDTDGNERKHTLTFTLRIKKVGDRLVGMRTAPNRKGMGETTTAFIGKLLPPVSEAPNLSKVKYGKPIRLFNGKDLDSHHMGALYSRITPSIAAEKPGGTWQSLYITLRDRHVTVKLNGKTTIDNLPAYGPTGGAIISDVFAPPGPIYLQGDHGNVSYRNIVLRPIL